MKGRIIAIEGVDGSGKETQSKRLLTELKGIYPLVERKSFPDYESRSSALVRMYLEGDFGKNPMDVDAYQASTFFALDRFASYRTQWKKTYEEGGIIIMDRYTTANMVHQAGKIGDIKERDRFLKWVSEFEFSLLGLPQPDITFFLSIPEEVRKKLVSGRKNKITGDDTRDIHEGSEDHIKNAEDAGLYVARKFGWKIIECADEKGMKSIDEIGDIILQTVKENFGV